jgi:hypothetical protein
VFEITKMTDRLDFVAAPEEVFEHEIMDPGAEERS